MRSAESPGLSLGGLLPPRSRPGFRGHQVSISCPPLRCWRSSRSSRPKTDKPLMPKGLGISRRSPNVPFLSGTFRNFPFRSVSFRLFPRIGGGGTVPAGPCCSKRGRNTAPRGLWHPQVQVARCETGNALMGKGLRISGRLRNFPKLSVSFRSAGPLSAAFRSVCDLSGPFAARPSDALLKTRL